MSRNRSRWWLAGAVVAGVAAVAGGLAIFAKKVFAPDLDDESLFDGPPVPATGTTGAATHPAQGSGTGWPEPQHTPEHTEAATAITPSIPSGAAAAGAPIHEASTEGPAMPVTAAPAPAQPFAPPPMPPATPAAPIVAAKLPALESILDVPEPITAPEHRDEQLGRRTARLSADSSGPAVETHPAAVEDDSDQDSDPLNRTLMMPPDHAAMADPASPEEAMPAVPSEPPVRPETPFTDQQAEMNLRLQEHQEDLLRAFPGMTVHDIVACDGDFDRLAGILAPKAGMERGALVERLQSILHVGPNDATNPGSLASPQAWPSTPHYVSGDPEKRD